jgi:hypothetical protein
MLNFRNPSIMNNDCYCCGTIRRHPKPNWHGCLNFKKPSCPKMNVPSHNVLAPSNAQHSKRIGEDFNYKGKLKSIKQG